MGGGPRWNEKRDRSQMSANIQPALLARFSVLICFVYLNLLFPSVIKFITGSQKKPFLPRVAFIKGCASAARKKVDAVSVWQ